MDEFAEALAVRKSTDWSVFPQFYPMTVLQQFVWRCSVLVLNGATTGVEEARTQLKEHLPECEIYLVQDDFNEEEDGLDGDEGEDE